jgi:serine/threonine protein kinase
MTYDKRIDVWGLGVVTYELMYGTTPFRGNSQSEIFKSICEASLDFPAASRKNGVCLFFVCCVAFCVSVVLRSVFVASRSVSVALRSVSVPLHCVCPLVALCVRCVALCFVCFCAWVVSGDACQRFCFY